LTYTYWEDMFIKLRFHGAKLQIICEISKKYFEAVDAEDAAVADTAALAGGQRRILHLVLLCGGDIVEARGPAEGCD